MYVFNVCKCHSLYVTIIHAIFHTIFPWIYVRTYFSCMYVLSLCIYVLFMCVCISRVCTYFLCIYVLSCVFTYFVMHVCNFLCMFVFIFYARTFYACMYVFSMHVCIFWCMYVCMYVCNFSDRYAFCNKHVISSLLSVYFIFTISIFHLYYEYIYILIRLIILGYVI